MTPTQVPLLKQGAVTQFKLGSGINYYELFHFETYDDDGTCQLLQQCESTKKNSTFLLIEWETCQAKLNSVACKTWRFERHYDVCLTLLDNTKKRVK